MLRKCGGGGEIPTEVGIKFTKVKDSPIHFHNEQIYTKNSDIYYEIMKIDEIDINKLQFITISSFSKTNNDIINQNIYIQSGIWKMNNENNVYKLYVPT